VNLHQKDNFSGKKSCDEDKTKQLGMSLNRVKTKQVVKYLQFFLMSLIKHRKFTLFILGQKSSKAKMAKLVKARQV
jgi:hypothetical protein